VCGDLAVKDTPHRAEKPPASSHAAEGLTGKLQQGLFAGEKKAYEEGTLILAEIPLATVNFLTLNVKDPMNYLVIDNQKPFGGHPLPEELRNTGLILGLARAMVELGVVRILSEFLHASTASGVSTQARLTWQTMRMAAAAGGDAEATVKPLLTLDRDTFIRLWCVLQSNLMFYASPLTEMDLAVTLPTLACRANHSCRPNATFTFDPLANRLYLHAGRRIEPGEEITICYTNNWTFDGIKTPEERAYSMGKVIRADACDCLEVCRGNVPKEPAERIQYVPGEDRHADLLRVLKGQPATPDGLVPPISYRFDVMRHVIKVICNGEGNVELGGSVGHIRELLNTFPEIVAALSRPWERQMMNLRCAFCTFMFGARNKCIPRVQLDAFFNGIHSELTLLGHDMAVENAVYEGALAQFMWPSLVPPTPSLPPPEAASAAPLPPPTPAPTAELPTAQVGAEPVQAN